MSWYSSCCFGLLASVEVQLVLQLLDNLSRLAAAATSRRMLQEATQPFSWKYAELVTVTPEQLPTEQSPVYSLRQLVPMRLRILPGDTKVDVELLQYVRRLVSCAAKSVAASSISAIVRHADAQQLTQLLLPALLPSDVDALCALPQLTSFHLAQLAFQDDERPTVQLLTRLLQGGRLVELSLNGAFMSKAPLELHSLMRQLRRLHVWWEMISRPADAVRFDDFFCALPQLECISLMYLSIESNVKQDELQRAFTALKQLHTLNLRWVRQVDKLLPHLTAARLLTTLRVWVMTKRNLPSPSSLYELQAALPALRTHLVLFWIGSKHGFESDPLAAFKLMDRVSAETGSSFAWPITDRLLPPHQLPNLFE
jgi:hypothetical protein